MHKPVIIVGQGEMGGVFGRGFLRAGHPVYPVTRQMSMAEVAAKAPEPELVLVAVAEADLQPALTAIPDGWRDRLVLLQNELLPRDWRQHGLSPTVISVWFEKKKGQDVKVLIPSPIHGDHARTIQHALTQIDIPAYIVDGEEQLLFELVRKNVYILTTNIAGLECGGNVAQLWREHEPLARAVASDVMDLQQHLCGETLPRQRLIEGMLEAFEGDPDHRCMGRSAPARLRRALEIADAADLAVPALREIGVKHL